MIQYILSQVCVVVAMAALSASYFVKNRKLILVLNGVCSLFFALEYLFLGAYVACLINAVGMIRIPWFNYNDVKNKRGYVSLFVISAIVVAGGIWSYSGWPDILVIVQGVLFTYSLWQKNVAVYVWLAPLSNGIYVIYNIIYRTLLGVIFEVILFIISVVALIKMIVNNRKKSKQEEVNINSETQEENV